MGRYALDTGEYISMRTRATVICLVAGLLALPLHLPSQASTNPTLAGITTIRASNTALVDVVLAKSVVLPSARRLRAPEGPAPWLRIAGPGRVVGVVLTPEYSDDPLFDSLIAIRFQRCEGCRPVNALSGPTNEKGKIRLKAGNYRLRVLADGDPVEIRLELPGLSGTSVIVAKRETSSDTETPTGYVDVSDNVTVYSAGASYRNRNSQAIFMAVNVLRDEEYRGGAFHECVTPDHQTPDDAERVMCVPIGGFQFSHTDLIQAVQPTDKGLIVVSLFGINDRLDNEFNGDTSRLHYNFRVASPGSLGELWSQAAVIGVEV